MRFGGAEDSMCPIISSVAGECRAVFRDYLKDGRIVAIEILDAGKRTTKNPLDLIDFSIVKEKAAA